MISRLHLKNFRRHLDTELNFGAQDQLIAITGVNGAGKSSILEGLLFALYGETRNGRRGLDTLVSRGRELEGVEVTCEFSIAGSTYRIQRRRVEKVSSALLFCDGQLVAEGPSAVDAQIRNVLGMDAAGFKLAVIAKQKELDGLTSLSRQQRRHQLARLLRVDVVARAATLAHDRFSAESEIVAAMGPAPDIEAHTRALVDAEGKDAELAESLAAADSAIAELVTQIDQRAAVEQSYAAALEHQARAAGAHEAALGEVARLDAELAAHEASPADAPPVTRDERDILAELRALEAERAQAMADRQAAITHQNLVESHREVVEAIARLTPRATDVDVDAPARTVADLEDASVSLAGEVATGESAKARLEAERAVVSNRAERLEALADLGEGGECPTCTQAVSHDHVTAELDGARQRIREIDTELTAAASHLAGLTGRHAELTRTLSGARGALAEANAQHEAAKAARTELVELTRRRDSYELRLTKAAPAGNLADVDGLAPRFATLEKELAGARAAESAKAVYDGFVTRRAALSEQVAEARVRAHTLAGRLAAAQIPADVAAAHAELEQLRQAHSAETELRAGVELERASNAALVELCRQRLGDAETFAARRQVHADAARIAAYTKTTLKAAHQLLSQELRPNLEGALSEILTRLSEGRFTAARLDEEYEVTVLDDGAYRPLTDLSGGEVDLVALSLRLALASVVAERHGSDAVGLLILDEVFGSQDASRREAILTALRELRSLYGQVFVISHVGGIEDAADKVVELHCGSDRKLTEVAVL